MQKNSKFVKDEIKETFLKWYDFSEIYSTDFINRETFFSPMVSQHINDECVKIIGKRFIKETDTKYTNNIILEEAHEILIPYSKLDEYFKPENEINSKVVFEKMCSALAKYPNSWFEYK
jgi:hypothetical protein